MDRLKEDTLHKHHTEDKNLHSSMDRLKVNARQFDRKDRMNIYIPVWID